MKLFKNEVGRPSNETLRKRRIFYTVVAVLVVLIIGGGSFFVYNKLNSKDIESEGKDAGLLKFTSEQVSVGYANGEEYCIDIEAPSFAKNWRVQLYWKESNASSFGNNKVASYNHYNDGVRTQRVCTNEINSLGIGFTFRVLIKATTGANDTVYTKVNPNVWKPLGWNYNSSIGWAYKDYYVETWGVGDTSVSQVCRTMPGLKDYCRDEVKSSLEIIEPSNQEYNVPTTLKFKLKLNKSNNFTDEWPLWYRVFTYDAKTNRKVSQSTCRKISTGNTQSYIARLNKANVTYYYGANLYADNECKTLLEYEDYNPITVGYRYTK